jgi:large subunit ribosomal protein L10
MPRPEKVATVEEIRTKLESARAAVLTEYRGLKVAELANLRASLRAADAEYKIFKNTLARRAAEQAGLSELTPLLDGPTAITFVRGDAVLVAKALRDYARTNPALVLKGGVLGTRVIRSEDVVALADIQPREVLLARIAGGLQSPLTKAASLFQAFTRNMAYGLKALIDQRVAAGESAEAPAAAEPAPAEPAPLEAAPLEAEAPPAAPDVVEEAPTAAAVDGPPPAEASAAEPEEPAAEVPAAEPEVPAAEPEEPAAEVPAAEPEEPAAEPEASAGDSGEAGQPSIPPDAEASPGQDQPDA